MLLVNVSWLEPADFGDAPYIDMYIVQWGKIYEIVEGQEMYQFNEEEGRVNVSGNASTPYGVMVRCFRACIDSELNGREL